MGADAPLHQSRAHGPQRWRACALRPARAAETRRILAAAAAAVVAGAMRIRGALYECMRRGRCGATGGRVCRDARAYPICVFVRRATVFIMRAYNRTALRVACAWITIVSIRWRAR